MLKPSISIQGTKWISVAGFIPGATGFTESEGQTVTPRSTLLLPCSYFFQLSSVLSSQTSGSHSDLLSGACFSRSSFLRIMFCKDIALLFFQYSQKANRMPCQSVPHIHKALSCGLLKRFISVTKEVKQRELMPPA